VILYTPDGALAAFLEENKALLRYLFIASEVELGGTPPEGVAVESGLPVALCVEKAKGLKCQRCWNYSEAVGKTSAHPTLCERCVAAVS